MSNSTQPDPQAISGIARGATSGQPYTAIIHFHGMGSQRRYEEPCRLIDAMDRYLDHAFHDRGEALGRLVGVRPVQEPHRPDGKAVVTYIRAEHVPGRGQVGGGGEIRVYECYWAPVMAGSKSALGIAKWMGAQVLRPIYSMLTPWWERKRLRESMLLELRQSPDRWPDGVTEDDFDRMLRLYARFMRVREVREEGKGYFRHFSKLIARGLKAHPETEARMQALASRWWWYSFGIELRNAFLLLTLLLTILLSAGGVVWSLLRLLEMARASDAAGVIARVGSMLGQSTEPTVTAAAALALSLASFVGATRFLTDSMGDVQAWATYAETDATFERRRKVLDMGQDILSHVLNDDDCERAVITAHSLGTSVAYDTISAVALSNRAHNRADPIAGPVALHKIRHFVTMGSPIDKIHYFFGGLRSKVHAYVNVLDQMYVSTGAVPFLRNRKPHIHWINYWDDADPISGPLHSSVGQEKGARGVDDVHVENYGFPAPAKSHNAYFANRTVIGGIFGMAVMNDWNYGALPLPPGQKGYDYDSVTQGPGRDAGARRLWVLAALAVPWGAGAAIFAAWRGATDLGTIIGGATAIVLAILLVAWKSSVWRGNREPL